MGKSSTQFFVRKEQNLEDELITRGLELAPVVSMEQVHGNAVTVIQQTRSQCLLEADAAICASPGVVLTLRTADCLPVLISHPSLIAAVHAGRAGTEQEILRKTLEKIRDEFGVKHDLEIWFGPAICEKCYQIDREKDLHYDLLKKNSHQVSQVFHRDQVKIITENLCTREHPDAFYSYRNYTYHSGEVGNNFGVIALR